MNKLLCQNNILQSSTQNFSPYKSKKFPTKKLITEFNQELPASVNIVIH